MKIAVVTGASSGLGAEFVRTIAERHNDFDEVWIIARRKDRLEQLSNEITACKIRPIALDLTSRDAYNDLSKEFKRANADIRQLVNNAGYCGCGRFDEMSERDIYTMIDLNITALTMVNKVCFPFMNKGGCVILTCSASSFVPVAGQAVYSASKAYVRFLGHVLHTEMKQRGINVLTLCPGNMDTEMNVKGSPTEAKAGNLPYLNINKMTRKALIKVESGKGFYTPGWFYKGYRFVSKIFPHSFMINFTTGYFE